MVQQIKARVIIDGEAEGKVLKLSAPICFWGGVDTKTSAIADPLHPEYGVLTKDCILAIPAIVGSSSSSQLLLELMRLDLSPLAIILGERDIIVATAVLVGREMNYRSLPILQCDLNDINDRAKLRIRKGGIIEML